jgi:hypothetical protein
VAQLDTPEAEGIAASDGFSATQRLPKNIPLAETCVACNGWFQAGSYAAKLSKGIRFLI